MNVQDGTDLLKSIISQVPGEQISQQLLFLALSVQVHMHDLG